MKEKDIAGGSVSIRKECGLRRIPRKTENQSIKRDGWSGGFGERISAEDGDLRLGDQSPEVTSVHLAV